MSAATVPWLMAAGRAHRWTLVVSPAREQADGVGRLELRRAHRDGRRRRIEFVRVAFDGRGRMVSASSGSNMDAEPEYAPPTDRAAWLLIRITGQRPDVVRMALDLTPAQRFALVALHHGSLRPPHPVVVERLCALRLLTWEEMRARTVVRTYHLTPRGAAVAALLASLNPNGDQDA